MYAWDFGPVWAHADLLALGLLNTLKVTAAALTFGVPLGLALALMRLSPRRALRWPAGAVIEVFRTTPPLVQLFWFFFALPILLQVEMTPYAAAVLTFSIQSAAFFAEVFRGGIVSIERGQWEAGRALGMTPRQVLRRIVLPMREVVNTIMRRGSPGSDPGGLDGWYTDLYDHVIRAAEWTESLRDMVTTVFETNLSLQDARLNTIMKKLTGWAAIIAVPTLVTGWYGQNVPYPGYGNAAGVWTSAVLTVLTSVALYVVFKRRDWL